MTEKLKRGRQNLDRYDGSLQWGPRMLTAHKKTQKNLSAEVNTSHHLTW